MNSMRKVVKRWFRRHGYEVRRLSVGELDDITRVARMCDRYGVSIFLDIGANVGQFAIDLRVAGYRGQIISFEPLFKAHEALLAKSVGDSAWRVFDRIALGRHDTTTKINVSRNSYSSSLLPIAERHVTSAPPARYVGVEDVCVRRLDGIIPYLEIPSRTPLAVKIDTQGYEMEVLAGAALTLPQVKLLHLELSFVPLYSGAPTFDELYGWLRKQGFRCAGFSHEFSDPDTGEMLQVNGTFVREEEALLSNSGEQLACRETAED